MQTIKDESPDMYDVLHKLWINIIVKEINNNLAKYADLKIEFMYLNPFD